MINPDTLQSLREILNVSELSSELCEILGDHYRMYCQIGNELDEKQFKAYYEVPEDIDCWDWVENRNYKSVEELTGLGFTEDQAVAALFYLQ
jgi:hypothetical protein